MLVRPSVSESASQAAQSVSQSAQSVSQSISQSGAPSGVSAAPSGVDHYQASALRDEWRKQWLSTSLRVLNLYHLQYSRPVLASY